MGSVGVASASPVTELVSQQISTTETCDCAEIDMAQILARTEVGGDQVVSTANHEELRLQHLMEMRQHVPGYMQRLSWSQDQLRAHRERRLRELLQTARERSTWHRERLKH